MQRRKHQYCPRTIHLILAAACGGPLLGGGLFGCSSDHLLGEMPEPESPGVEEPTYPAEGRADFQVSPELGPPDLVLEQFVLPAAYASQVEGTSVGDLDGDGYEDLAMYGPGVDAAKLSSVHIRYGRPRPQRAVEIFDWDESGGRLAIEGLPGALIDEVMPLGDLDADGYADILVRTAGCEQQEQLAFIYYGGPQRLSGVSLLEEEAVLLKGLWHPGLGGRCALDYSRGDAAGDFNGDGYDDFALSDRDYQFYTPEGRDFKSEWYAGGTYLFYGGPQRIVSGTAWTEADVKIGAAGLELIDPGDVDGDGLADLLLGQRDEGGETQRVYWLPGQTETLPPQVSLEGIQLAVVASRVAPAGDLDGDGRSDLLLYGSHDTEAHLFYGQAGMLQAPLDVANAAASVAPYAEMAPYIHLIPIADRDGDGDDELLSRLYPEGSGVELQALLSGSAVQASGAIEFPVPSSPFRGLQAVIQRVFPVGDLDGDGAGDVLTHSRTVPWVPVDENGEWQPRPSDAGEGLPDDVWHFLSIHFGTPGGNAAQSVR